MRITINFNRTLPLLTGIGLVIISSCSSKEKNEDLASTDVIVPVVISHPIADSNHGLSVSGLVEAAQSANISTRIMGFITSINVGIGDHVSKGQLLATISNDDILAKKAQAEAMIAEADAGYKNAQKDYDRFTVLFKQQSASAKELDNVTQQYNAASAKLEATRQMRNEVNASLHYSGLTAPFSGTVTQKLMDAGSMANPGVPLLTIEQSGSYQVSALVPENEISLVHEGASVTVTVSAVSKVISGRITRINPSSAYSGGQYIIKVRIPDNEMKDLFAGMYADLSIPATHNIKSPVTNEQVLVPVSSIQYKDELTGLYTVGSNHTALLRWVRLGKIIGSQVEVLSGLAANEQFIVSAEGKLYNGITVKIK